MAPPARNLRSKTAAIAAGAFSIHRYSLLGRSQGGRTILPISEIQLSGETYRWAGMIAAQKKKILFPKKAPQRRPPPGMTAKESLRAGCWRMPGGHSVSQTAGVNVEFSPARFWTCAVRRQTRLGALLANILPVPA